MGLSGEGDKEAESPVSVSLTLQGRVRPGKELGEEGLWGAEENLQVTKFARREVHQSEGVCRGMKDRLPR